MDNHRNYILELLDNEEFIQWLIHPTQQSDHYWNEVMSKDDEQKRMIAQLRKIIQGIAVRERSLSRDEKLQLWANIRSQAQIGRKKAYRSLIIRISAAAAFLLLLAGSYFLREQHTAVDYLALQSTDIRNREKVQLILSGDKTLELEEDNVELVYDQQGKLNVFLESEEEDRPEKRMNHLIVPYGKTSSIVLSDGTKVWVNSGSQVIYPAVFSGKQREIFVNGEIYLEVAHHKKLPFVVTTEQLEINVLGTSFNVQAYQHTAIQSVVLAEGLVKIRNKLSKESVDLTPNQMYSFEKETKESDIRKVDIYNYICWKYGFLHFDSEKIGTVLERLERYYNVEINYDVEKTKDILVSGKLDMKENLSEVLNSIELTAPITFEITGSNINVKSKK